jgi:hypothetical protein
MAVTYLGPSPRSAADPDNEWQPQTLLGRGVALSPLEREFQRENAQYLAERGLTPDERLVHRAVKRFDTSLDSAWHQYGRLQMQDALDGYYDFSEKVDKSYQAVLNSVPDPAKQMLQSVLSELRMDAVRLGLRHWDQQNQAVVQRIQLAQADRKTMSDVPDAVLGAAGNYDKDKARDASEPSSTVPERTTADDARLGKSFDGDLDPKTSNDPLPYFKPGAAFPFDAASPQGVAVAAPGSGDGDKTDDALPGIAGGKLPLGPALALQIVQSDWFKKNKQAVADHLHTKLLDDPIFFPTPGLVPGTIQINYRQPELGDVYSYGLDLLSVAGPLAGTGFRALAGTTKAGIGAADIAAGSAQTLKAPAAARDFIKLGEYAGESIPARSIGRSFTKGEREQINRIGSETGCHTCGTKEPGTPRGNFVVDHQPPSALNRLQPQPQRLYPQCFDCSSKQGTAVLRELRKKVLDDRVN